LKNDVPILIMSSQEMARRLAGWESREVMVGQSYNLINTYDTDVEPGLVDGSNSVMQNLLQHGKTEGWCNKVWDTWGKKGGERVNNMDEEIQDATEWICPLCRSEGWRINRFYGQRLKEDCLVVTTGESI